MLFRSKAVQFLSVEDIGVGLLKATVFGFLIALVSCHKGYTVRGGAREVGFAVQSDAPDDTVHLELSLAST